MIQEHSAANGHHSSVYENRESNSDRISPPVNEMSEDIIDAEIIEPETSDRKNTNPPDPSFNSQQTTPISSYQIVQNFDRLEQQIDRYFDRFQEKLDRVHLSNRRKMVQSLHETDERIGRKFRYFHDNLNRLEIKLDALLSERRAKESRRTILILLSVLVAGVAYITIIYPLLNRPHLPQNNPPELTPQKIVGVMSSY
ncbi:MAG: hypothetical protein J7647_24795 [Cyanobacteria bacterium SBLK]|nr:hypothetical protein [Cyanobacteria bacterium SBLK]